MAIPSSSDRTATWWLARPSGRRRTTIRSETSRQSRVVRTPQVMVVNDTSPLKSVKDLIAAAKAKPGSMTYATAGVAGSSHVLGAFFNIAAGIDTIHVPYKGGGPGMLDLRAGRVSYMITSMVSSLTY